MSEPWEVKGYVVQSEVDICSGAQKSLRVVEVTAVLVEADSRSARESGLIYPTKEAAHLAVVERANRSIDYHRNAIEAAEAAVRKYHSEEAL